MTSLVIHEDFADIAEAEKPGSQAAMIAHYAGILSGPGVESGNRLDVMLALLTYQPSAVFWPVFHAGWKHCDGTWELRRRLADDLRRHNARRLGATFLPPDDREWLETFSDPIRVYRGCSRERVKAASWTTDSTVAEGFARGHRFIKVPDPVIASALVPKAAVFGAYRGRNESELVLDAEALADLLVT